MGEWRSMNTTRISKIARLPLDMRDGVNRGLESAGWCALTACAAIEFLHQNPASLTCADQSNSSRFKAIQAFENSRRPAGHTGQVNPLFRSANAIPLSSWPKKRRRSA
jgi:hypothetical protein